ncbi:hypothetical protein DMA11_04045 [Marinilabiliaceae bacterium JC017]|nr:hypothetical protein DMA11_04045 [Marinilabiliaceae bacterium JC017]
MDKTFRKLTPKEVFFIFKEEHRLCSQFDCEAGPNVELTMDSSIKEWRYSMDLLPWRKLGNYLNEEFEIDISKNEWKSVLEPSRTKKLGDVCRLISKHAQIEIIKPIKIFGKDCLSASLFKTIKINLTRRGVDTSELKPSSLIEPYLKNYFGELIEQINKNYTGVIPELKTTETKLNQINSRIWLAFFLFLIASFFWNPFWIITIILLIIGLYSGNSEKTELVKQNEMMFIPGIKTFRDLVETIIEKKYATQLSSQPPGNNLAKKLSHHH